MFLNRNYIGVAFCFSLQTMFCIILTEAFVYDMEGHIEIAKYNKVTGETFIARGNVVVRLSVDLTETGRYKIGEQFVKDPECAHIELEEDTCKDITNTITVMELLGDDSNTMLFLCLKLGENKCHTLDIGNNITKPLGIINSESFFDTFSGSSPSASISFESLNNSDNQTKYLLFTHDIYLKQLGSLNRKPNYFSVFSLIKVTDIYTDLPKVTMLSNLKLHINHNFVVLDAFQVKNAYYFVVRYWDQKNDVSDSVIQVKVINETIQLIETRMKCKDSYHVNQTSLLVDGDTQILYVLNSKMDNGNSRTVCEIDAPSLESYFHNIHVECTGKNKGSYPNWLNLSNSDRSRSPCDQVILICFHK
jgi:hypothetical protein